MDLDDGWRSPTEVESLILWRMLQARFPGVEELREQAQALRLVKVIDDEGSLSLQVETDVRAVVETRVPVEADYSDSGNYQSLGQSHVHILLHVVNGVMQELEFYKDDGTPIERLPAASELHIFTPYHWEND